MVLQILTLTTFLTLTNSDINNILTFLKLIHYFLDSISYLCGIAQLSNFISFVRFGGGTLNTAQGLFLALCSGVTPGGAWGRLYTMLGIEPGWAGWMACTTRFKSFHSFLPKTAFNIQLCTNSYKWNSLV